MEVYLDNSATTRCFDRVIDDMARIMREDYGNPSSMHNKGVDAEKYLKHTREVIARSLKVTPGEILFTSGGTESDNMALIGCAMANHRYGKHLITTVIEHPAILKTMQYLEEQGFSVTYLPVDETGRVRLEDVERAMTRETILVSVMHVNNEIGSLQPIEEIGALVKRMNPRTLFHVDAVQGFGKAKIYPKKMNIDLVSVSGHKIHGPKGIGFLYISDKVKIKPILFGGGQQDGMRSGTENVPAIAGLGTAVEEIMSHMDEDLDRMYALKEYFATEVVKNEEVYVNGLIGRDSAPHVISVSFRGVRSEVMLHALEDRGIYVSAGSACSSHKRESSATLRAIGVAKDLLDSTLRFSISVFTTREEIDYTLKTIGELLPFYRRYR